MATTSVLAVLPASAITFRTSAALSALHATLNASSQQDSFKNASTWGSQAKGSAYIGAFHNGVPFAVSSLMQHSNSPALTSTDCMLLPWYLEAT